MVNMWHHMQYSLNWRCVGKLYRLLAQHECILWQWWIIYWEGLVVHVDYMLRGLVVHVDYMLWGLVVHVDYMLRGLVVHVDYMLREPRCTRWLYAERASLYILIICWEASLYTLITCWEGLVVHVDYMLRGPRCISN